MALVDYTTLTLVKEYGALGQSSGGVLSSTRDDPILNDAITAYSRAVDDECQWTFSQQTLTDELYTHSTDNIGRVSEDKDFTWWLKTASPTVQSVTALSYKWQWLQAWQPIDLKYVIVLPADASLPPSATRSYRVGIAPDFTFLNGWRNALVWFKMSYTGGYATIPSVIQRVTTEWVWIDYKLSEHLPTASAGFIGMPMTVIKPNRIPPHLAQLLGPWKRTAVY